MKFEMTVKASGTSVVIVEAENKDEATAQVKDMKWTGISGNGISGTRTIA